MRYLDEPCVVRVRTRYDSVDDRIYLRYEPTQILAAEDLFPTHNERTVSFQEGGSSEYSVCKKGCYGERTLVAPNRGVFESGPRRRLSCVSDCTT